ncbi:hypothetical protein ACFQH6_17140 [Halobacteriaceae archaeon GCM10025711]
MADLPSYKLLAAVVAAGVIVPGVLNYWLAQAGHATAGDVVWVLGYGLMVVLVWYGWLRPLDLGPTK